MDYSVTFVTFHARILCVLWKYGGHVNFIAQFLGRFLYAKKLFFVVMWSA